MSALRRSLAAAAAIVASLACAASASAFGLSGLSAAPANGGAGANSDFSISLDVTEPSADLRDLTIHLPPGLVGNPLATPTCSEARLANDACAAASDVGDVTNGVTVQVGGFLPVPLTVNGNLYNVTPRLGEPARFGIVLDSAPVPIALPGAVFPKIILQSAARLRQSDFGLDTILDDLPRTTVVAGMTSNIDITSIDLTLKGEVGNPPKGFLRNPTSCKLHRVGFDAVAYSGETASGETSFSTNRCGRLPFSPKLRAVSDGKGFGPIEFSTTISQTLEEAGLATAEVVLPSGLTGDNELLGMRCPRASFEAGSCPASTIVGTARAESPLQSEALVGTVAIIEPSDPGLPDIGLDLRGPLALKLTGELGLDASARAVTTFAGLPDIPISDFKLTFTREPGFVIAGVDMCQTRLVVDGAFLAHSGARTSVGAPIRARRCGGQAKRKPKAKLKLRKLGSNEPTLRLKVKAGDERMRRVALRLPGALGFDSGRFAGGVVAKADGKRLRSKAIKHSGRVLKLKGKRAIRLVAKIGDGALTAKPNAERRMRFAVKVVDVAGKRTKLRVRSK